jgi:hypothetical protein
VRSVSNQSSRIEILMPPASMVQCRTGRPLRRADPDDTETTIRASQTFPRRCRLSPLARASMARPVPHSYPGRCRRISLLQRRLQL